VGDTHTTRKWEPGMAEEETRFVGLKRECGLHEGSYSFSKYSFIFKDAW
jgi:3'-phosphoadenosine 5'-phosphosulfate sulfotransferase (PAPS reductase)/FAD synthetase